MSNRRPEIEIDRDGTVTIYTGKETIMVDHARRHGGPLVAVNRANSPEKPTETIA